MSSAKTMKRPTRDRPNPRVQTSLKLLVVASAMLPLVQARGVDPARGEPVPQVQPTSSDVPTASRPSQIFTGRLDAGSATLEDGSYYATHTVAGTIGETVAFQLTSADFDTYLVLQSPTGEPLVEADDGAGGTNSLIAMPLPVTGTYTLVVKSYAAGETGNYRLEVRAATAADLALFRATQIESEAIAAYQAERYAEAVSLLLQAIEIKEQQLGKEHPDVASSLSNLAELYRIQGRYGEVEPLYLRILAVQERLLGVDHIEVAKTLNKLATLYHNLGRYGEAESIYRRVLAIREQQLGGGDFQVAVSLNNLAELYREMGRYEEAEPLYLRSLEIKEQQSEVNYLSIATSLNNLATLYSDRGRYAEAESLYLRSLEIREQELGANHLSVAVSLNNLALLYQTQGRYEEAESFYLRSLAIREQQLEGNHPDIARSLNNLALLYGDLKRYAEAESLYQRALAIWEQQLGATHPLIATNLSNLAALYQAQGRYTEAESLYQRSLAIREQRLGADHPDIAISLNNLASLYSDLKRYAEAERLFLRALAIWEQQLGADHPYVALCLNNLASLYRLRGRNGEALSLFARAADIEETHLAKLLAIGSEARKQAYLATLNFSTEAFHSFALQTQDPQATRLALTTLLRRKGRILDTVANSLQILQQQLADDPAAQAELTQLIAVRAQLATLIAGGQGDQSPAQYRRTYEALLSQEQELETSLNQRSATFQAIDNPVTIAQVQALIPANAALVELVRYTPHDPAAERGQEWGSPRYAAYVLRSTGDPQAIALGDASTMQAAVDAFRQTARDRYAASRRDLSAIRTTGQALHALLVEPLQAHLGDSQHLLLSPDADLNLIPFEALSDPQGTFLLEQYAISYLTSGRDLLRLATLPTSRQTPVIIANPDYERTQTRRADRRSNDFTALSFSPLPGTQAEANALEPQFARTFSEVTLLVGTEATEERLKQLQAPSILHIATHGFFLADPPEIALLRDASRGLQQPSSVGGDGSGDAPGADVRSIQVENPLLRSGLALAKANLRRSDTGSDREDGIVTGMELTGTNLFGTQLVALSACETGLGETTNGQGVYGLRRALVMAGAQSQLISLWKVNDFATKDLMVDYYRRLLDPNDPQGRQIALRQAQLAMLNGTEYSHPYFWAAFILSGDWRPLSSN